MSGNTDQNKDRAARNRTLLVGGSEIADLKSRVAVGNQAGLSTRNKIVAGLAETVLPRLRPAGFDLLFADPPYNLTKQFGAENSKALCGLYEVWLDRCLSYAFLA